MQNSDMVLINEPQMQLILTNNDFKTRQSKLSEINMANATASGTVNLKSSEKSQENRPPIDGKPKLISGKIN